MESAVLVCIIGAIFLSPPILAVVALLRFRKTGRELTSKVLVAAVLVDWLLLIGWYLAGSIRTIYQCRTTLLADVLVLFSLLLLVGSLAFSAARWKLGAASLVLLSLWVYTEQRQSFWDDGSTLSVLLSRVADNVEFLAPTDSFTVLHKIRTYQARGYDDAAIDLGTGWTEAHPRDVFNDRVFAVVAWSLLNKAKHDNKHAEDYVGRALVYRNEALLAPSEGIPQWDSISTVRDLAIISMVAGDISPSRRCVEYGNALKLLERRASVIKDKQEEVSRRFVPVKEDPTPEDFKRLVDTTQTEIDQVRKQQQKSACR